MSPPFTGIVAKDVVAGLLGPHGAHAVARAAVQEAASRGARVRFLQITSPGARPPAGVAPAQEPIEAHGELGAEPVIDDRNATFTAALRALREFPRVPVTFEAAVGEPGAVLVEHTTDADILVLAAGLPEDVAAYCRRHASCDILTVRPAPIARTA